MNTKVSLDDIINSLYEDRSFTKTLEGLIEGDFEGRPVFLKHQLDILIENAIRRLAIAQEEDAHESPAHAVNE